MSFDVFLRGELPRWVRVQQQLDTSAVEDVGAAVAAEFARPHVQAAIGVGTRVALGVGSRGIDRLGEVVKAAVSEVRRLGAEPYVVPAMGSHGGATADGQIEVLAHYGVTPDAIGCAIRASMETALLGQVDDGVPVWFDRIAATEADAVIPINRIKPHTDFHAEIESGLVKMIAIGLGKQKGADTFHGRGFDEFQRLLPAVAQHTLRHVTIPFGLALVENGFSRLSLVEAVPGDQLLEREKVLLEIARERLPRLPAELIDVLIVDYIGKDISGIGADTNVLNRYYSGPLPLAPRIQRVVVRDLTPMSEGNASGIGLADVVLRQATARMDPVQTYMNCITAKTPEGARVPLTVATDREALHIALACCVRVEHATARIARIRDTKHLECFWASEPLLPQLLASERVMVLGTPEAIRFDDSGMFADADREIAA
ncbi:MAG: hypothetical protein LC797_04360 [Chloroflexi bacterium]|nr:hypothetical protein [Chloroflexota bacterium]